MTPGEPAARRQLARSLLFPVAGRSAAGLVALTLARPLIQLIGVTSDPVSARRVGVAIGCTDWLGVLGVLLSPDPVRQRAAARVNAGLDCLLGTGLLAVGLRRRGRQRAAAVVASGSVFFGAGAWLAGARHGARS